MHLNPRRTQCLSSLQDTEGQKGENIVFAESAIMVLKAPSYVLAVIYLDYLISFYAACAKWIETRECFFEKILLLNKFVGSTVTRFTEVVYWLSAVSDQVSSFFILYRQVC